MGCKIKSYLNTCNNEQYNKYHHFKHVRSKGTIFKDIGKFINVIAVCIIYKFMTSICILIFL